MAVDVAVAVAASVDVGLDPSKIEMVFIHMLWTKQMVLTRQRGRSWSGWSCWIGSSWSWSSWDPFSGILLGFFWDSSGIILGFFWDFWDSSWIIGDSGSTLGFRL